MHRLLWRSGGTRAAHASRQQQTQAQASIGRAGRFASSSLAHAPVAREGTAVLYRGPPAMSSWVYFVFGSAFSFVGLEMAYSLYHHLTWPLTFSNPENQPKLASQRMRIVAASVVGVVGAGTGFLFFAVPTKTVTKLTLRLATRQLVVRTATREFSALFPRAIYPAPLRRTAERKGYYVTDRINERVVPLSSVYRIRGSATAGALSPVRRSAGTTGSTKSPGLDERQCLEIRSGDDRFWYRLESAGGADPPSGHGYAGFFRRFQHRLRGKTDWEDGHCEQSSEGAPLGDKETWFADRRTFDDVIPLVKRR